MTIRHLKIFIAVCEYGGITRAAEALHITQPAISHTISELEKYYNIRLFDRINQRLVITDMGKEALDKAREIVGSFEEFESFASLGENNPRVRIGFSLTLGQTVMPQYLKLIASNYSHIKPIVKILPSNTLEEQLEKGNLDFALLENSVYSPYLCTEAFKNDRLVLVSSSEFDVPDYLSIDELKNYPLLFRERGNTSREYFENMLSKYNLHVEPAIESANNQAIIASLYACLGIALLPESFVSGHIQRGKFKELHIDGLCADQTNYIVKHKNKRLNVIGWQAYNLLKEM